MRATADLSGQMDLESLLVFDGFENSKSEKAYNPELWTCSGCGIDQMRQENGVLLIESGAISNPTAWDLISIEQWRPDRLGFVEADLRLDEALGHNHADVHLQIWAQLEEILWWASCDIISEQSNPGSPFYVCHDARYYADDTTAEGYATPMIPGSLGTWHRARIEIDPETFRLAYYIDDRVIGSHLPTDSEELLDAFLRPQVGMWTEGHTMFLAQVDSFFIGRQ